MKKYKNQILPYLLLLLVTVISACSGNNHSKDATTKIDTARLKPPPEPKPSGLVELESDLEMVKTSIKLKEKEYFSNTGEATRAVLVATSHDSSPAEKKLARESAESFKEEAKKNEAEIKELEKKQAEINAKISKFKKQ